MRPAMKRHYPWSATRRQEAVAALASLGLPVSEPAEMKCESVESAGVLPHGADDGLDLQVERPGSSR